MDGWVVAFGSGYLFAFFRSTSISMNGVLRDGVGGGDLFWVVKSYLVLHSGPRCSSGHTRVTCSEVVDGLDWSFSNAAVSHFCLHALLGLG